MTGANNLYNTSYEQIGLYLPASSQSPFFVDHLDSNPSPCFRRHFFCNNVSLKICLIFSFVSSQQFLICSDLIPLLSPAFPLLRRSHASWISLVMNSGLGSKFPSIFLDFRCTSQLRFSHVFFAFVIFVQFSREFCERVCNTLSCCDDFAVPVLDVRDLNLLLC